MNADDSQLPEDQALDAMLARAQWAEPSADSTRRMLAQWRGVSPQRGRMGVAWAAPAAMLIVGFAAGMLWRGHGGAGAVAVTDPIVPDVILPAENPGPQAGNDPIMVRAPSALEMMLIKARGPVHRAARTHAPTGNFAVAEQWVTQAEGLKSAAELDRLAGMIISRQAFARPFAGIAATSEGTHCIAAVALLSRCAGPEQLPALLSFYGETATHDAALPGVVRLADATVLGWLLRDGHHRADWPVLLSALLGREPGQAVPIYLTLIKDRAIAGVAAGLTGPPPPMTVDAIFAELNSPQVDMRESAARALGQIDGPATTARLVAMAERGVDRREALMALAYSKGIEAREYLARAQASGPLRSSVRTILLQVKP